MFIRPAGSLTPHTNAMHMQCIFTHLVHQCCCARQHCNALDPMHIALQQAQITFNQPAHNKQSHTHLIQQCCCARFHCCCGLTMKHQAQCSNSNRNANTAYIAAALAAAVSSSIFAAAASNRELHHTALQPAAPANTHAAAYTTQHIHIRTWCISAAVRGSTAAVASSNSTRGAARSSSRARHTS
jgi:hypothetical protein